MKNKNRKGQMTPINTSVEFIIIVAVVLVVGGVIYFYIPSMSNWLESWLCDTVQFCVGNSARSDLERAVLDAYYMCTEGCSSSHLVGASSQIDVVLPFSGNPAPQLVTGQQFCNSVPDFFKTSDGKLCGFNFPIELSLIDSSLNKNHISDAATCIATEKSSGGINWNSLLSFSFLNYFQLFQNSVVKTLFIPSSLVSDQTETCQLTTAGNTISNAISSGTVNGKVYVGSVGGQYCLGIGFLSSCAGAYVTGVYDKPTYTILTPNVQATWAIPSSANSIGSRLSVRQGTQVLDDAGIAVPYAEGNRKCTDPNNPYSVQKSLIVNFYCGGNVHTNDFCPGDTVGFCNYLVTLPSNVATTDSIDITYVTFSITAPAAAAPGETLSLNANLQKSGDIITFNQACLLVNGVAGQCDPSNTFTISDATCTIQNGVCGTPAQWTVPTSISSGTVQITASDQSGLTTSTTFKVGTCGGLGGSCVPNSHAGIESCIGTLVGQNDCSTGNLCCVPFSSG